MDAHLRKAIELGEQAFKEAHEAQRAAIVANQKAQEAASILQALAKTCGEALIRELGIKGELK